MMMKQAILRTGPVQLTRFTNPNGIKPEIISGEKMVFLLLTTLETMSPGKPL